MERALNEPVARVTDPLATRLRCLREAGKPLASVLVDLANKMADRGRAGDEDGVGALTTEIVRLLVAAANAIDFEVTDIPVSGPSDRPEAGGEKMIQFKSAYMKLCDELVACYDDPETLLQCFALIIPDVERGGPEGAPSPGLPSGDGSATPSQYALPICSNDAQANNLSKMDMSWLQYAKVLKVRALMRREKLLPRPREEELIAAIARGQEQADKAMQVVRTIAELPSPDRKLLVSTTGSAKSWLAQAKAAERQVSELKRELAIEQSAPPDARLLGAIARLGLWKIRDLETYLGRTWASPPAARPLGEPQGSPEAAQPARAGKRGMRARLAKKSRKGRIRVRASIVAAKRRATAVRAALARFVARVRAALSRPGPSSQHAAGSEPAARAVNELGASAGSDAAARLRRKLADAQHAEIVDAREIAGGARRVAGDELATLEILYRQAAGLDAEGDAVREIPGFPRGEDTRLVRSARMAVARWGLFLRTSVWNQYAESVPAHELDGGQAENGSYVHPSKPLREFLHVVQIAEILKTLSEEQLAAVSFGLQCQKGGDYMPTAERETFELMSHLVQAEDEARQATGLASPPVLARAA
ncbi:hypothetical protein [Bordetella sp. LUAb4]|uniref:hypothetical protein n=1 Tax=Bordetella sp. LUAb4 TaxID=2843195 RepID=UPI001E6201A9|nr:hypothetical protein [Bordetella sp. LUAb4]